MARRPAVAGTGRGGRGPGRQRRAGQAARVRFFLVLAWACSPARALEVKCSMNNCPLIIVSLFSPFVLEVSENECGMVPLRDRAGNFTYA